MTSRPDLGRASRRLALAACLVLPLAASADIQWDFTAAGNAGVSSGGTVGNPNGTYHTFSAGGIDVTVSGWRGDRWAWSIPDSDRRFRERFVKTWDGLGVGESSESSPTHAVDNSSHQEFLLFSFSEAVTLSQVSMGWFHNDSDITVLAWGGAGDPTIDNRRSSQLLGDGWDFVGHYSNLHSTGYTTAINNGAQSGGTVFSSSYWLVGAYNNQINGNGWTHGNDHLKISALSASLPPPPSQVSEPASLGLLLGGLAASPPDEASGHGRLSLA
jgi:hypothetical protein